MVASGLASYNRHTKSDGANLHHHWVQMKTDIEDPDLLRPGGFERQVRGRLLGSSIVLGVCIVLLVILQLS